MMHTDLYTAEKVMDQRLADLRREGERHQAHPDRRGWWRQGTYWLLGQLGHLLITAGEQLDAHDVAHRPLEGPCPGD